MLNFLRTHQKYFFVAITIVIIFSFSFFGTYGTLQGNSIHEQVAFTTATGEEITRGDLEEMAYFIGTDAQDKLLFGAVWGPNFLNDGVIRNDLMAPGLAALLANQYSDALAPDLDLRFAKEVNYKPYSHPQAPYLSSVATWNYFSPEIPAQLNKLQTADKSTSPEAIRAKIELFLNERRFPAYYLSQVLRYQERQNSSLSHDPRLDQTDFSLFGYHTIEDWFGSRFLRLMSEFIINAAAIAEEKGYQVSKDEALADLYRNALLSFKQNEKSPNLGVDNPQEYFDQQLLRMRLDKSKAAKIWQKVLLFRRLFQDIGNSIFIDPFAYRAFNNYSNEALELTLYRLPEALRIPDFHSLQLLETYLNAVAKRSKEERNSLNLPKNYLPVDEIAKKTPELVNKEYEIELSSVSKKDLEARVTLKESLDWELDGNNWTTIKAAFPELGLKKSSTREERLEAIDSMDGQARFRLEQLARSSIVTAHPEWIAEALSKADSHKEEVRIALRGFSPRFKGLDKGETLIQSLDKNDQIDSITFNGENYYRIKVLKRTPGLQVLTFEDATRSGVLDKLSEQALELHYAEIRNANPAEYQKADKSWKSAAEVKNKIAASYYAKLLDAIKERLNMRPDADKFKALDGERLAVYRFVALLEDKQKEIKGGKEIDSNLNPLASQFEVIKTDLKLSRNDANELPEGEKLFLLPSKAISAVIAPANGDLYFAAIKERSSFDAPNEALREQIKRARTIIGSAAERVYLETNLLPLLKDKGAISFDFMNSGDPSIQSEEES